MNCKIKEVEKRLGFPLKKNVYVLGVDIASTTGLCIIETTDTSLSLETKVIKVPAIDKDDEKCDQLVDKLEMMHKWLKDFSKEIKPENTPQEMILVIENSYLGYFFIKGMKIPNAYTYGHLKTMQGLSFATLYDIFDSIHIWFATTARAKVGFKSVLPKKSKSVDKKKEIIKFISHILQTKIKGDNTADSILLALAGLKEE